jgi:tetratricopeptide (TPR) repeat protein
MPSRCPRLPALLLLVVCVGTASGAGPGIQESQLGTVEFPTSGSPHAQSHFLRGVAALHSFWYEEALEAFREATKGDPDFMMGYWGEAMAHNHPIWREQDTEAARQVVAKIKDSAKLTPRERAYLNAVKRLYGEGDKATRDKAYSAAMEKLYRDHPEDLEAACFYALSLLAVASQSDNPLRTRIQAGALALDVFRKNPDHPCAAHYTIHAFDDPDHAILALHAARRYAKIAPESPHALHMPAHIFLQLGMWPEAAASNEAGWKASVAWVKRQDLPLSHRDYHSLYWLMYVYLQQGRYRQASDLLALKQKDMAEADGHDAKGKPVGHKGEVGRYFDEMVASYVVETERWDAAGQLGKAPGSAEGGKARALPLYTRGLVEAQKGLPEAEASVAALQALRKQNADGDQSRREKPYEARELQVAAVARAVNGAYDEAIALMKKAVELEEKMKPPSGPPEMIKPSHELFGEILLRAGRPLEAAQQFAASLRRHPMRARSLLGAARAAAQSGDRAGAAEAYAKLLEVWSQADAELPALKEARDYAQQEAAR